MALRSNNDSGPDREPSPLEATAIGWVVRCDRGLSGEQGRELAAWLAADPRHRDLFDEFGGTWSVMARAGEDPASAAGLQAAVAALDESTRLARGRRPHWPAILVPLAAAAAIIIAMLATWRHVDATQAVATEVGVSRELRLADGSLVRLNTDTVLAPAYSAGERRVRLTQGEAYFEVAKDAARPFVVEAAGVGMRALGTAFNVRVRPESVEVLVTEGRVRVAHEAAAGRDPIAAAELVAGDGAVVLIPGATAAGGVERIPVRGIAGDEIRRTLAWRERRIEFSDTALGEMVAEFNRYHRHKLVVADVELARMRFGGSFRPEDRAGFVRLLRENFGITADEGADRTVLRASR